MSLPTVLSYPLGLDTLTLAICTFNSHRQIPLASTTNSTFRGKEPERLEEDMLQSLRVNLIGNMHVFNLFIPLVLKGNAKKVITLSSGHADHDLILNYDISSAAPYTISKAAMNTAVAKYSAQYGSQGVLFMSISPGVVDTADYSERKNR